MKTKVISLISVFLLTCLSGCTNNTSVSDKHTGNETVSLSALSINIENITDKVNSLPNMQISDKIEIHIPYDVSHVYEYKTETQLDANMENYYNDFIKMFEYLFPEHEINNDFLFYIGGNSELKYDDNGNIAQNFNKVSDWYNKLIDGEEGRVNFLYDETWFRDMTEWKEPVCFEVGNPIGCGYAVINKGKTVELNNSKIYDDTLNAERYPLLESYDPADWLEYVGTYPPDSMGSFKLSDTDITINDAVIFFEEYINELPYPKTSNTKTVVVDVDVYKVSEDIYGYNFLTTKEYQGITFDYMKSGTVHSKFEEYTITIGNAFMVESNDIDIVYGYYRLQNVVSEKSYNDIVTINTAAEHISQEMTDGVVFEIQKIELVYAEIPTKTSEGYIDIENPSSSVSPAWKFTLYNSNDNLRYVCYLDAIDGENFRYYTSPAS